MQNLLHSIICCLYWRLYRVFLSDKTEPMSRCNSIATRAKYSVKL